VKVSDFQQLLRSVAAAVASAKGASKELIEAADALAPFGHHSIADFAAFLKLAETTYRETGQLPAPAKPKAASQPKAAAKVTADQLQATIASIRDRVANRHPLTREGVKEELAKFEALPKPALQDAVARIGYASKLKTKRDAIDLIVERLLAGTIAGARAKI
jgi:ABC-type transporter Mla subunit MlaD